MDWLIRAGVVLFVFFVAFLLLLEAIHVIAHRVRDWRDLRASREWLVARQVFDERRAASELRPRSNQVERR